MMQYFAGFVTDSESIMEFLGKRKYTSDRRGNLDRYFIFGDPRLFIVKERSCDLVRIYIISDDEGCTSSDLDKLGDEFFKITGAVKIPFRYVFECL